MHSAVQNAIIKQISKHLDIQDRLPPTVGATDGNVSFMNGPQEESIQQIISLSLIVSAR